MARRGTVTVLTERGQVSLPAALRKAMQLEPGRKLRWHRVSPTECRVTVELARSQADPMAALGYARRHSARKPKRTSAWMKELRAGERR